MIRDLVFVHGWASTPEIWQRQKEYFSKNYTVVTPDIGAAKDIKEAGEIVCACFKNMQDAVLVGWSLGGMVILEILRSAAVKPRGVVLVNSTAKFVDDGYLGAGPKNAHLAKVIRDCRRDPKEAFTDFYRSILSDRGKEIFSKINLENISYGNLIYGLDMLKEEDYREFIRGIETPTLIIAGIQDVICPKEASEYLNKRIKNSKLKELDCGHMPFLTNPLEFNSAVEQFLRSL